MSTSLELNKSVAVLFLAILTRVLKSAPKKFAPNGALFFIIHKLERFILKKTAPQAKFLKIYKFIFELPFDFDR